MSQSFHMSTTGVPVVSLYSAAPVFCCALIWTPSSHEQDTQSFICPLIGFQNQPLEAFGFWITESPNRPPCMVGSCGPELDTPHQSAGGPGLSHIMVRLMRSDSERCSWLGDKNQTPNVSDTISWLFLFVIAVWPNPEPIILVTRPLFIRLVATEH